MDKINPMYSYWYSAKKRYKSITGKRINYRHPKDLNEKLMWLTRYWQHPLKTKCADKYLVREYVKECGLESILVPLIAVYNDAHEINFDILPDKFILKCNHGSGFNITIKDKRNIESKEIINQLDKWMSYDYSKLAQEIHYHNIQHRIVCEVLISENAPTEYQFRMINGKPINILAVRKSYDSQPSYVENAYNLDWTPSTDYFSELPRDTFERPKHLDKLIQYAKILSKPFPFVRVDFYEVGDKIFFAELTFTPAGNILDYSTETLKKYGELLVLPPKHKEQCIVK
jgi:hypothetical protein